MSKFYGSTRALRDVSVVVAQGEVVAFAGANGSGKSTLLRVFATLTRPSRGTVRFPALGRLPSEVRPQLGFVSHEVLAYDDLTVLENVGLAAQLLGPDAERRVAPVVERLGMGAFAGRPLRACSRGQRQRVAIARALVGEPRLLLLDEPTTGLDDAGIGCLRALLRAETERGTGIAVVVHDQGWASDLITREVFFDRGRAA